MKIIEVTEIKKYVVDECPKCNKEIRGKSTSQVDYWMIIHNPGKGNACKKQMKINLEK